MTGVTGGISFKIEKKNCRDKYLQMGFTNPVIGCYKTHVGVWVTPGAMYAYEHAEDDSHKLRVCGEYRVEAVITASQQGGDKQMIFTISDAYDGDFL